MALSASGRHGVSVPMARSPGGDPRPVMPIAGTARPHTQKRRPQGADGAFFKRSGPF